MVKNAIAWATQKGYVRQNEIHGETECKIPTKESFSSSDIQRTRQEASMDFEMQACCSLPFRIKTKLWPLLCRMDTCSCSVLVLWGQAKHMD